MHFMLKNDFARYYLPEINNIIGKPWTLRVMLELRRDKKSRYNDLLKTLEGVSSSTLTITLKNLQAVGFVDKESFGKKPPFKVGYSLTEKGFDFLIAFYPLLKWANKKQVTVNKI